MNWSPAQDGKVKVGILGAGMIATCHYGILPNIGPIRDKVEVVSIADMAVTLAEDAARTFGIPHAFASLEALLAGPHVDAVVNITPGHVHFATSLKILEAGKHLVVEKPITSTVEEATALIDLAESKRLVIVASPPDALADDWVLAKKLIDDGVIGKVAFARVQSSHGGDAAYSWLTDPTWTYQRGAGSLREKGVYGLHEIIELLGPAKRVSAMSGIASPKRWARGGPFDGLEIDVTEADNTLVLLDFGDSTFANVDATFCVPHSKAPRMEIYGLDGCIVVNRPDVLGPSVEIFKRDAAPGIPGWITPVQIGMPDPSRQDRTKLLKRAVLVDHLADCLLNRRAPVLSAAKARHALEIMLASFASSERGETIALETTF